MPTFPGVFSLKSLNGTNGFKLTGEAVNDYSGVPVASAGDVNHDGFDDLVIGAGNADPNGPNSGACYVVFGKASGFSATLPLSSLNGTNGFKITGQAAGDLSGLAASAGDFNHDGFADLIVGAVFSDAGGVDSGAAYVVFGKASGFSDTLPLSSLNGANGFSIPGEQVGDFTGFGVASAGDVNGDGFDDVIVGSYNNAKNTGTNSQGAAYVLFGNVPGSSTFSLSTLNGSNGFKIIGTEAGELGAQVSSAGDVNGDGYDDVVVSKSVYDISIQDYRIGSAVVFGKAAGFPAQLSLSSLNGSNGFNILGTEIDEEQSVKVTSAGDINGDGYDDLVLSSGYRVGTGNTYVIFGKASGFPAQLTLSSLNGQNGFKIVGDPTEGSGVSVSSAGDVNADGFDDLIIGANDVYNDTGPGASYVVYGKASGYTATFDLSGLNGTNGFKIVSEADGDGIGLSVSSAGDVNGDGADDLIVGAPGSNPNGNHLAPAT